jgi:dimethylhistidine N-methyltransferase
MTFRTATVSRHDELLSWRRQFLRDVIDGLKRPQKQIPCKYFYDELGSALFDEICELDEYYLTRSELAILRIHASEMAELIGDDSLLIEFGSGSGLKTRLLLERLRSPRVYLPVDIAREHLENSARELACIFPRLRIVPVHADFTGSFRLPHSGDNGARRVVYFPGSTVGNFSPPAALVLLRGIADLVGKGGGLLIGFDLDKDESVVWPAYNDSRGVTAAFNLNLLARINRELAANFDVTGFSHRALYLRSLARVEMHLVSEREQVVHVGGRTIAFAGGETIHTEDSYKYSPATIGRLTAQAGFSLVRQWLDPRKYFSVQYLTVD